eukprot:NODE_1543_length_819_cov_127.763006_g1495_i0.p1 GENE.NODE_1543_length_819_cov_127.763006_g1495_i0~~NODE_1543_length_819_cov_127.763006_g1495_i0.p1  ORF type:complete len:227 (+),score=42.96 NODE_1543_length_819_cov_127.763006_g1495_i0:62-742(+)
MLRRSVCRFKLSGGGFGGREGHGWMNRNKNQADMAARGAGANIAGAAHWVRALASWFTPGSWYWYSQYKPSNLDNDLNPYCKMTENAQNIRRWIYRQYDNTTMMMRYELEEEYARPYVGVDHIYEPHFGSLQRPMNISWVGWPNKMLILQCDGECNLHVPEYKAFARVPDRSLCICADCGLHFTVRTYEPLQFDTMGGQLPDDTVEFEQVAPSFIQHQIYGSPLVI